MSLIFMFKSIYCSKDLLLVTPMITGEREKIVTFQKILYAIAYSNYLLSVNWLLPSCLIIQFAVAQLSCQLIGCCPVTTKPNYWLYNIKNQYPDTIEKSVPPGMQRGGCCEVGVARWVQRGTLAPQTQRNRGTKLWCSVCISVIFQVGNMDVWCHKWSLSLGNEGTHYATACNIGFSQCHYRVCHWFKCSNDRTYCKHWLYMGKRIRQLYEFKHS